MELRVGLLVLALAVGEILAGPIQNSRSCATKQCTANSKLRHYQPGQTYVYKYDGSISTKVNGASEGSSGMLMSANAHIEAITGCEFALKLTDVTISETDASGTRRPLYGAEMFTRSLETHPVRFAWHDGHIEEVCPDESEKTWITNIKRAVLSSFQNSQDDLQTSVTKPETDITGKCPAEYRVAEKSWSTVTVDRSKDLLACTERHGYKTAFQATPYRVASDIQSLPLTKSSHNCRQTFHTSGGYLQEVECKESHVFRPFSKESNGAATEATHKLVYQRVQPGVSTSMRSNIRRSNLLYEHEPDEQDTTTTNDNDARVVLRDICEHSAEDVRPETPKLFSQLVHKMTKLETRALKSLHQAVQNSQVCSHHHASAKKFFHDAIPMTGTVASVSLIKDLINSRHVKDSDADMWLTSLAFIQKPKPEMVQHVKELLSRGIQNQRNFLSTSALVHNYCRHNTQCHTEEPVKQIVQFLESNLGGNCRAAGAQQDRVLMSIKALGNMGVAPQVAATLGRCAAEKENSIESRLAALDSLRQQPCEAERAVALRIFEDREQEDEVRIAAYLASMKCADHDVIMTVKRVLESETGNQVGSFVWTHLTNLMETDDAHKSEISNILNNVYLKKEFDMDRRKYSRNYEGSVFLDSINTGAKVESNIIWSRKSFVPRSAMMNMTVDLFGQSINFLEVGGRVEGMERLLETFFGPQGYFPEKTVMDTLRREKRQVANHKMDTIHRTYDGKGNQDNIKGNMYFKVFGTELGYVDLMNLRSTSDINILDILIKLAQNHNVEIKKSIMFLDTSITIPTIVGLPLRLSVNGTATINIGLSGKMDVRRAHPSPRTVDIDGKVRSSAAIQIASLMSVDAFVAKTGLKMITTLHSSTELDGKLQIQNSQIVTVNVNMPRERQEIISVDNQFFTIHQSEQREQLMPQYERVQARQCTGDSVNKVLGVELCGEISYPQASASRDAPFYPLTGPSRMALVLNKKDTHTAYQFEAKMLSEKVRVDGENQYKRSARLMFDTPGSQTNRNFLFDLTVDRPQKALKLDINTPWKKMAVEGSVVNEPSMKRAGLHLTMDDSTEYSILAEVQVDEKPEGKVIYPNIKIKMPNSEPMTLNGNIAYKKSPNANSINFNLRMVELFRSPVKVTGSSTFDHSTSRLNTDLKLECPLVNGAVEGYFEMSEENHRSRFSAKYTLPGKMEESLTMHYKLRNTRTGSLTKVSVVTSLRNSMFPEYNNKLKWELQKTSSHAETTLDFQHGHTLDDAHRRLQASVISNYMMARSRAELDAIVSLSYPAKNLKFTTRLDHKHHSRMINTKASINYANNQNAEVALVLNNLSAERLKLTSAMRLSYPGREMVYKQAIEERQRDEFLHSLKLQWQRGSVFSSSEVVKREGHSYTMTSQINCPGKVPIFLKAAINAAIMDAKLMASYEQSERKYATEAGYTISFGSYNRDMNLNARVAMETPKRKHVTVLVINHNRQTTNANLNYEWSKDDVTKVISVKGTAKHQLIGRQKEILASVEMKTPFSPIEEIGARFQYTTQTNLMHNANFGLTWAPRKTITLEGSGRVISLTDFDLKSAITTPFHGYKRMTANLRNLIQNDRLSLAVNGGLQTERVDLELSAQWHDKLEGAFKFRLPSVAHSLEGKFNHEKEGSGHVVKVEAVWDDQAYTANIRGIVNSVWDADLSVIVLTPIRGYQRTEATYRHLLSKVKVDCKVKAAFAGRDASIVVLAENKNNYRSRDVHLSLEVVTPFRHLRLGKIALTHRDDGQQYMSQVIGKYNDKALGYTLKMDNNYQTKMSNGDLKIDTPISGYQRMVYTWRHRMHSDVLSTNEIQINGLRYVLKVSGNHNNAYGTRSVKGLFNLETPHDMLRTAVFNLNYKNSPDKLVTSGVLAVNGNTASVSLDATGSRRDRLVCNLNLNVEPLLASYTTLQLKPIIASLTFDGQMRPKSLVSSIRYGVDKEIRLEGTLNHRNSEDITGSLVVNTPYFMFRRIALQMKHQRQYQGLVSEYSTSWDNNQAIVLKSVFAQSPSYKGDISVDTPFDIMKRFSINFNHKQEDNNQFVHTNQVTLNSMNERISFSSGATYRGSQYINAFSRFSSPFDNYRNLAYQFTTHKTESKRVNSFDLELSPGEKTEIKASYGLRPFDMTLSIKTPFRPMTNFQSRIRHSSNFPFVDTSFSYDMTTYFTPVSGVFTFNMQDVNDITAKMTCTGDRMIELTHKLNGKLYTTKLQGKYMQDSMSIETKFNIDEMHPSGELKVFTPFKLSTLGAKLNLNMRAASGSFSINNVWDGVSHRFDMTANPGKTNGRVTLLFNSETMQNVDMKLQYYYSKEGNLHSAGITGSYQNKPLKLEVKFQNEGKFLTELNLLTPLEGYEKETKLNILSEYEAERKTIGKFNLKTPFMFLKGLKLEYEHKGTWSEFVDKSTFEYDASVSRIFYTDEWKVIGLRSIQANARLITPFKNLEYTGFTINHILQGGEYDTKISVEYAPGRRAELTNVFSLARGVKLETTITSPSDLLRKFALKFDRRGSFSDYNIVSSVSYNDVYTHSSEVGVTGHFLNSAVIKVAGPETAPITIRITQNLKREESFDHTFVMNFENGKQVRMTANINTVGKMEANLDLKTPFETLSALNFHFEHSGRLPTLINKISFDATTSKGRTEMRSDFNMESFNVMRYSGNMKSPYEHLRDLALVYSHKNEETKKEVTARVMYAPRKAFTARVELEHREGAQNMKIDAEITTPFEILRDLRYKADRSSTEPHHMTELAVLTYNGGEIWKRNLDVRGLSDMTIEDRTPWYTYKMTSVKNNDLRTSVFTINYAGKTIKLENTYRLRGERMLGFKLETPWEYMRDAEILVKAQTSSEYKINGDLSLSMNHNKLPGMMKVKLDWQKGQTSVKSNLIVKTPYTGYTDLSASMTHRQEGRRTGTEVNVQYMVDKSIKAIVNIAPDSKTISLKTPFEGYQNMRMTVDHRKSGEQYTGEVVMEYDGKKMEGNLNVNLRPYSAKLELKTPYVGYEDLSVEATHTTDGHTYQSSATLQYMTDKTVAVKVDFSKNGKLDARITVATPISGFEEMYVAVKHEGSWIEDFETKAEVQYMQGKKIEASIEFENNDKKELEIKLKTPFENFLSQSFEIKHEQFPNQVANTIKVQYLEDQVIESKVLYKLQNSNTKPVIDFIVSLKTPYSLLRSTEFVYKHEGLITDFTCQANFKYNDEQNYGAKLNFRNSPAIIAGLEVTTPFPTFERQSFTFTHRGHARRFTTEANLNCHCGVSGFKVESTVYGLQRALINVNVFTPHKNFESMNLALSHSAGDGNFKTSLEYNDHANRNNKIEAEGTLRPLVGKLNVMTQWGSFVLTHTGDQRRFATQMITTYGSENVNMKVTFDRSPNMQLKIESPWAEITLTHNGDHTDFTTTGLATVLGHRVTSEVRFRLEPVPTFNAEITSPKFSGIVSLSGSLTDFRASVGGSVGAYPAKVELNWTYGERITAGIKYTGDMRIGEPTLLSSHFNYHNGQLTMATNAHLSPSKIFASTFNYKHEANRASRSIELRVNTPFADYRELSTAMYVRGNSPANINSGLTIQYKTDKKIELTAAYKHKDSGSITIKSPCPTYSNIRLNFAAAKVDNKDGYEATVQWTDDEAIRVKVAGILTGDIKRAFADGYLEIITPLGDLRNLVVEGTHRHSNAELDTSVKISYNHDPIFDILFDLEFSQTAISGHTTMIRPLPLKLTTDLQVDSSMKKADIEFSWDTSRTDRKVKLSALTRESIGYSASNKIQNIILYLPSRVVAWKAERLSSATNKKVVASFAWDENRDARISFETEHKDTSRGNHKMWDVVSTLKTPIRTIQAIVSHTDNGRRYTADGEFSWDLVRNPQKKIGMNAVAEVGGEKCVFEVVVRPPRTNPMKFRHESRYMTDETIFWTTNTLSYSERQDETFTATFNVRDSLVGRHHNYSSSLIVSHPASNILVSTMAHFGQSYRSQSAGMVVQFMTASGANRDFHILAQTDSVYKRGELMISTPITRLDMNGRLTQDRYGYKIDHETSMNGANKVWGTIDINSRNGSMDFKLHYDNANPNKALLVTGWYLSNEAQIQALHNDGARTEVYALASVKLNTTRVLHTRLHWKPTLVQEIKDMSNDRFIEMDNRIRTVMNRVSNAVDDEVVARRTLLTNTLPDVTSTYEAVKREAGTFREDAEATLITLELMFARNEFYMQDAATTAVEMSEVIGDRTRTMRFEIRRALNDYQRSIRQRLSVIRRKLDSYMARFEEIIASIVLKFRPAWQSYAYSAIRSVQNSNQALSDGWEQFKEGAADNHARVVRFFDDRFDYISYKMEPFVEHWISIPDNIFSAEEKNFFSDIKEKVLEMVVKIEERYMEIYTKVHDRLMILSDSIIEKLEELKEKLLEHRAARVLVEYASELYVHAVEAWEVWEVPKTVFRVVKTLYRETKAFTKEYLRRTLKKYLRIENSGFTVWDPEHGEIQASVFLPLEVKQLDKMPKIDLEAAKEALYRIKERFLPTSNYSLWDTYYKYKPSSNPIDWIPPFKAHAILAHGKHYTTFDGKHFDFAGTCSYVLARDFIDGNFTVVANYQRGKLFSMTVKSNGKNIEIFDDYKVTVDDHRRELPYEFANTTVTRSGYKVLVHNTKGVTVQCDLYNKICTTNITGWYYGKTAGLFGTYNNEQSDDMLTSSRRTTIDMNEFTRSWEIGTDCTGSRNMARTIPSTTNEEINSVCENYFKSSKSIFRHCFGQVKPDTYLKMCISDIQQDYSRRSVVEKACSVSSVYLAECKLNGVDMSQDSQCIKCTKPNGSQYQDTLTVRNSEQMDKRADVVLLVEEKPCNRQVSARLESLVNILDNSLKASGISNTRFAVVGFGGRGVHNNVHHHTMEGQLFNEARKIRPALRSLDLTSLGSNTDVMGAIYEATKLRFRTGASKSILVIPCSDCKVESIGYAALQQILNDNTIHLHVLAEHEFQLRTNSPKTNYIFGIDKQAAYTMYNVNQQDLRGDAILHRQVVMPKNLCGALALSNNGSMFNRQKLVEGRSKAQKSFIDILARRVARTAYPMECQICDCVADGDGVGKSVCRSCHMPSSNSFFKKFFPSMYQHAPDSGFAGNKAELSPIPLPEPRHFQYQELDTK